MCKFFKCSIHILLLTFNFGCIKNNTIDFSSSKTFFASFNKSQNVKEPIKKKVKHKGIKDINEKEKLTYKASKKELLINKIKEDSENKNIELNLTSFEKKLKGKIGSKMILINHIFGTPNSIIKHGKVKNLQFHFKTCYLDLFFMNSENQYNFKHFEFRASKLLTEFDRKKCFKEVNNRFKLLHLLD